MKTISDDILISRSQSGNQMAFGVLVERYSNFCYSIVFRIVGNEAETEDVVQEAFILAWKKVKHFNSKRGKFTTWLYTIATHLAIDALRKQRKRVMLVLETENEIQADDALAQLYNRDLEAQLKQAMKSLTVLQKAVFVLREIEEIDVAEVAVITGLSPKQIKDNLYVARKKVREQIPKVISI
ncbi:RNA polymerase sigma factor [Carboxylicivirga sp. A043]|uniref:RNA polymerase sigma factor n=1 Tax=Carboxylicivirga litoralis TaxID=2816963 RepID=UPI0021CB1EDC|nr:RNA polymerase sigma factor [Carboxylicivirga sp. A043]MCU4155082.1 RNA polymerase sigma factor [Carboxylicivirga sp. A043]